MIRRAVPLLLLTGCMYRVGGLVEATSVRVRILDTRSERRAHEFDLSWAVARELLAVGVRVNAPDAEHELVGEILDFDRPAVVVDEQDVPIVGSVSIRLRIRLIERTTGKTVFEDERTESADFADARFESPETARQEVFDRLARWVATKFETEW